ncbi:hypothetical protein CL629_01105 [bacterium]|nr:hypothetical protein [bacterium]
MLATILKIGVVIALIIGATYLVPDDIKKSATSGIKNTISKITPDSVKEKIEPIIFTPAQRREKLIEQLEKNIEDIKKELGLPTQTDDAEEGEVPKPVDREQEELAQKLQETKTILKKLQDINDEQGLVNKVTTNLYKTATGEGNKNSSTTNCE